MTSLLFGVALGNVVRGVPIGTDRRFTLAFFTNFLPHGEVGLLDYYTVSVGLLALVVLLAHGAAFLAFRTDGALRLRARHAERRLWLLALVLFVLVTFETMSVRPELFRALLARPLAWFFSGLAVTGAVVAVRGYRVERDQLVFVGSSSVIAGILAATATALYPVMLKSTLVPEASISAEAALGAPYGLSVALAWWPVALALAVSYLAFTFRANRGKVREAGETGSTKS
jgi:cytochrome d ubiquinol oxidase subunit II